MLRDRSGAGLVQAYVRLAMLGGISAKAQRALGESSAKTSCGVRHLSTYFARVQQGMGALEERLWSTMRAYMALARNNAAALVAALQVVEMQEVVDVQFSLQRQEANVLQRRWRNRCLEHLSASVQETFAPLLQRCSQLFAQDTTQSSVADILNDTGCVIDQFGEACQHVVPCFPQSFQILSFLCSEHHRHVGNMLQLIGLCAEQVPNADILFTLAWLESYSAKMAALGLDCASQQDGFNNGMSVLLNVYGKRTGAALSSWLANIMEADHVEKPSTSFDGRMWTPAAVDLFRIIDEQLALAAAASAGGPVLLHVGKEAVLTMRTFQKGVGMRLRALSLEHLCAVANNSLRCHALAQEFARRLETMQLDSHALGEIGLPEACEAFMELARQALDTCIGIVYSDPGVVELIRRVACTEPWRAGIVTSSVLATLDDFIQDFERWLEPQLFQYAAEAMLLEAVSHYLAAQITQLRTAQKEDLMAAREDASKIASFFSRVTSASRAATSCQALTGVCDFLSSDSAESFELAYTALLETAPGITPALMANLLAARMACDRNITKSDAREVVKACKKIYQARGLAVMQDDIATLARSKWSMVSSQEALFTAALNAARKRPAVLH